MHCDAHCLLPGKLPAIVPWLPGPSSEVNEQGKCAILRLTDLLIAFDPIKEFPLLPPLYIARAGLDV